MSKQEFDTPTFVANHLDSEFSFSPRDLLAKFLLRWRLFALCALTVPLVALILTLLIPPTYKASALILIRHEGGTTSYFRDVTMANSTISGKNTAEVVLSVPVGARMVEMVGVEGSDIARPAFKVLFGYFARFLAPLLGKDKEEGEPNPQLEYQRLAMDLEDSIEAKTLAGDRTALETRDELVSITLRSTNRHKVDRMVNGLCEAYIEIYNEQAEAQAMLAYETLGEQISRIQADVESIRLSGGDTSPAAEETMPADYQGSEANVLARPLAEGIARQVSDLEIKLVKLRQTYREDAPEVQKAKAELDRASQYLARQESMDSARALLSLLKRKQREALLAAQLYRAKKGDVTIVERAVPPKVTKFSVLMHYGLPVAVGLVGGMFIGSVLLVLLGAFDPKVRTAADVESSTDLPVIATLKLGPVQPRVVDRLDQLPEDGAMHTWLHILGKLEGVARRGGGTVLVTSPESATAGFTGAAALNLAALLSHDPSTSGLLIDADLQERTLSKALGCQHQKGLTEALRDPTDADGIQKLKGSNLNFLPAGQLEDLRKLAFVGEAWETLHTNLARRFGIILLHSPGILDSRETVVLGTKADRSLLVAVAGTTEKLLLGQAKSEAHSIHSAPVGVILLQP